MLYMVSALETCVLISDSLVPLSVTLGKIFAFSEPQFPLCNRSWTGSVSLGIRGWLLHNFSQPSILTSGFRHSRLLQTRWGGWCG